MILDGHCHTYFSNYLNKTLVIACQQSNKKEIAYDKEINTVIDVLSDPKECYLND